ncbi:MAG: glycosyltransferase family 2 protein [Bryobacteraceae bacterium]
MISVIVVNWNRRELLRACLRSLERQDAAHEVIVVDNGSSDGSADTAEREFKARVIHNAENRGFCAANNQGIREARGDLIALLNNDAEAEPGWLSALARAFEGRPEVGMAASKILLYEDPRRIDKAGHLIYPDGQNRGRGTGVLDDGRFDSMEEVLWPDGCAAMYRRVMLDEIGGFDEDFFAYGDDAELGMRARIAGWKCLYAPDAVVRHHRGSTLGKHSARRLALIERNRVLLAAKLFPWRLLWRNPAYYAARIAAGMRASRAGRGEVAGLPWLKIAGALARGDLEALLLLPRILRKRGEVRRLARLSAAEICALIERYRAPIEELV